MFTRRAMFGSVAGVTAALSGTALVAGPAHAEGLTNNSVPEDVFAEARAYAEQFRPLALPGARTVRASVGLCRSWDRQIYLYASSEVRGFVVVDAQAFALATAAQATGRTIAAQYWGYEPAWAGVGMFAGVFLAVDETDLPRLS